ncbi:MAG: toxin-antitoxin system HicB family antitoxin [Opitutales bacterium]|nr:toxin-antitoxin system HicB family antitoxin [Opitutales bacterium]
MKKKSDAYLKIVEWSEEDQCYVGSAPPLIGPCCHGDNEARVYRQLCGIVDEWIEIHERDGKVLPVPVIPPDKAFSGRFVLRVDPRLHKALVIRSVKEGKSLNAYVTEKLVDAV